MIKVSLKLCADRVYYNYEPAPPERARWSSAGVLYAGGQVLGLTYVALRTFGDGAHILDLDGKAITEDGERPPETADERRVNTARFAVFLYEIGRDTMHGCIATVIMSCVESTARIIRDFLPRELLEEMISDAKKIPENPPDRKANPWLIMSSNGSFEIPNENLDAIRRHFLA